MSYTTYGLIFSTLGYLVLVRTLRWRKFKALHDQYGPKYAEGSLTLEDAQKIMKVSSMYDMPTLLNYSLAFALFKTYAIPSISKLLASTKELGSKETVSKRYADTEIMIATWIFCPISGISASDNRQDPRAAISIARVKWLHSRYPISNDDYLYTLGLFIFEPWRWAEKYGWRPLSPLEKKAFFMFWSDIGQRMGIKDIPRTPELFAQWCMDYEERVMVPAQTNHDVAAYTTEELLHAIPEVFGLKNFSRNLSICLLEDRVRIAMIQPQQPWYFHAIIETILSLAKYFHRYLCLPRRTSNLVIKVDLPEFEGGKCPRMFPTRFQATPWYKPQTRGPLGRVIDRLIVRLGLHDDIPGPKYRSQGYRLHELGPLKFEHAGKSEVMSVAEQLHGSAIAESWWA